MSCSVTEENYPHKPISNSVQKYIQVNSTLRRSLEENKGKWKNKQKQPTKKNKRQKKPHPNQANWEKEKYIVMPKHNKGIASLAAIK